MGWRDTLQTSPQRVDSWLRRPGEESKDEGMRTSRGRGYSRSPASCGLIGTAPRVYRGQHGLRTRPKHHATRGSAEECVRERERENFTAMERRHRKLLKAFAEVVRLREASLLLFPSGDDRSDWLVNL